MQNDRLFPLKSLPFQAWKPFTRDVVEVIAEIVDCPLCQPLAKVQAIKEVLREVGYSLRRSDNGA